MFILVDEMRTFVYFNKCWICLYKSLYARSMLFKRFISTCNSQISSSREFFFLIKIPISVLCWSMSSSLSIISPLCDSYNFNINGNISIKINIAAIMYSSIFPLLRFAILLCVCTFQIFLQPFKFLLFLFGFDKQNFFLQH